MCHGAGALTGSWVSIEMKYQKKSAPWWRQTGQSLCSTLSLPCVAILKINSCAASLVRTFFTWVLFQLMVPCEHFKKPCWSWYISWSALIQHGKDHRELQISLCTIPPLSMKYHPITSKLPHNAGNWIFQFMACAITSGAVLCTTVIGTSKMSYATHKVTLIKLKMVKMISGYQLAWGNFLFMSLSLWKRHG